MFDTENKDYFEQLLESTLQLQLLAPATERTLLRGESEKGSNNK